MGLSVTLRFVEAQTKQRLLYFCAGLLVGGLATAAVVHVPPVEAGTFVSGAGQVQGGGRGWTIATDTEGARLSIARAGDSISPMWILHPGWFVFLESDKRAWAFNGEDRVLVRCLNHDGADATTFGLTNSPFPTPPAVVRRIGEHRINQIIAAERASFDRLKLHGGRP